MNNLPVDSAVCGRVAQWVMQARCAVAFTGSGISTESGIPDFRSPGGVWSQAKPVFYQEFLASEAARREYWRQKAVSHVQFAAARPNAGHRILAEWETAGRLRAVITQNIDELHQRAGSHRVLELHGTAWKIACLDCAARYDAQPMLDRFHAEGAPPACPECGGLLKHATVSFGQSLPPDVLQEAAALCRRADVVFAIGSSLVVEPAASLPRIAAERGAKLVIVNREPTPLDAHAAAVLSSPIGETLTAIDAAMRRFVAGA